LPDHRLTRPIALHESALGTKLPIQWPQPDGFDAADHWPELAALLASRYVLDRSENENGIAWRLYIRRAPPD
jgi:hypothetical protein